MVGALLSKSGKGVLLYPGDGSVWITSSVYLRLLLDGKLRGVLVFKELRGASDKGLGGLVRTSVHKGEGVDLSKGGLVL